MKKVTLFDIIREYEANLELRLTAAERRWRMRFNSPEERARRHWFESLPEIPSIKMEDE